MSFDAINENKIIAKIPEFTVLSVIMSLSKTYQVSKRTLTQMYKISTFHFFSLKYKTNQIWPDIK